MPLGSIWFSTLYHPLERHTQGLGLVCAFYDFQQEVDTWMLHSKASYGIANPEPVYFPLDVLKAFLPTERELMEAGVGNSATCPNLFKDAPAPQWSAGVSPSRREYLGCEDKTFFLSTLDSRICLVTYDGFMNFVKQVRDAYSVDVAMSAGMSLPALAEAETQAMIYKKAYSNSIERDAVESRRNNPELKLLHAFNEYLNHRERQRDPKTKGVHLVSNAIYIIRQFTFRAQNEAELDALISSSKLEKAVETTLRKSRNNKALKGENEFCYKHAMFVYKIRQEDFSNKYNVLCRRTGHYFVSEGTKSFAHPLANKASAATDNGDFLGANFFMVFHDGAQADRYINIMGKAYKVPQLRDNSKAAGFYMTGHRPAESDEVQAQAIDLFVPAEKITEANGFFFNAESAVHSLSMETLAQAHKRGQEQREETHKKNLEFISHKAKLLTQTKDDLCDKLQKDSAGFASLVKEGVRIVKDSGASSKREAEDRAESAQKSYQSFLQQITQQNMAATKAVQDRYTAERDAIKAKEQERIDAAKSMLEVLKLCAALITVVGVIIKTVREVKKEKEKGK